MEELLSGSRLGEYGLVREVGRGAMGVVYEALHAPSGRRVALKVLAFPALLPEAERAALITRFAREARALAAVRHPGVVSVYEVGEVGGLPFMAMEFLTGLNAREWLNRHGPMPAEEVVRLGEQLCDALAAVHAVGIIHRDVKPENVVLEPDGTVRLTDFGIAQMEVEASLTRTGGLIGSPAYMAPEQILGQAVDGRSDLFSLGVSLYQMLTGELPFQGSHLMEVAHRVAYEPPRPLEGVSPALARVILRSMEKEPGRRYQGPGELRQALSDSLRAASEPAALPSSPADGGSTAFAPRRAGQSLAAPTLAGLTCGFHPGEAAVAACAECDVPVCARCVRYRFGLARCFEHAAPRPQPTWITRLEVLSIGVLFALLLMALYPLRW